MSKAARGILEKTRTFPDPFHSDSVNEGILDHVGVEPMLLALAMELALKAWFVFDFDDPKPPRTHDLSKLFEALKPESQERLDLEFKKTVAPYHPELLFVDYSIRHLLHQNKNAFVAWRYLHEPKEPMMFERSGFEAALDMVLQEFRKRYRVEEISRGKSL